MIYEGADVHWTKAWRRRRPGCWWTSSSGPTSPATQTALGFGLAMPVEKSGQEEFDFQYDEDFGAHIDSFEPNFSRYWSATTPRATGR